MSHYSSEISYNNHPTYELSFLSCTHTGAGAPGTAAAPPLINTAAMEVLRRLPGVTQAGARCVLD